MTEGQYRAIVAYLRFWPRHHPELGLDAAIADIGITDDRQTVISDLWKAGHEWNDQTRRLAYDG